jgi:hypothetical protein
MKIDNETVYTVYKTINLITQEIYVGVHKTKDPNDSYLGSGLILKQALKKYGKENFLKEILYLYHNIKDAYLKEAEIVNKEFVLRKDTYNLCKGGSVSPNNIKRNCRQGENHHMFGKKTSQESNDKRSKSLKITNQKESVKHNRSLGAKKSQETKIKNKTNSSWNKGKKLTETDKLKKSISAKNREKMQCEYCKKMCDPGNLKKYHFENCKMLKTIEIFINLCKNCNYIFTTPNKNKRCCSKKCENIYRKTNNV